MYDTAHGNTLTIHTSVSTNQCRWLPICCEDCYVARLCTCSVLDPDDVSPTHARRHTDIQKS